MKNIETECPRFQRCSVNNCPLTPEYPNWPVSPLDPERKCGLAKSKRIAIAAKYPGTLRYEGMTRNEFNAKKRWESMDPEKREKLIAAGKKTLSRLRK
jgi:hypothetical protein